MKTANGKYFFSAIKWHRWEGFFKNNLKHGKGKHYYTNGNIFTGTYSFGWKWKAGAIIYCNKNKYNGQWDYDNFHGEGTFTWADNNKFKGRFKRNQMSGFGEIDYVNGDKFVGNFKKNLRIGQGKYFFAEGGMFCGEFQNDQIYGAGKYVTPYGDSYTGHFLTTRVNFYPHEHAIDDPSCYEGDFLYGVCSGMGEFVGKHGERIHYDYIEKMMFFKDTNIADRLNLLRKHRGGGPKPGPG
jgi:hypothetical protein